MAAWKTEMLSSFLDGCGQQMSQCTRSASRAVVPIKEDNGRYVIVSIVPVDIIVTIFPVIIVTISITTTIVTSPHQHHQHHRCHHHR